MKFWLKAELHSHTNDDPEDGMGLVTHSAEDLIDRAAVQGFEVLSITNHNQLLYSARLQEYAKERGILLIPGVEATLKGKHTLLYNFLDYSPAWDDPATVSEHKGPEQAVVAPHPFFPSPTAVNRRLPEWLPILDGIEYNHFYLSWLNFNRRGQETAERLNLPLIGNSDVHHLFQLGCTYSLIYAEKEVNSVIDAVKQGDVRLVSEPVSCLFVARWFGRSAMGWAKQSIRTTASSPVWNPARQLLRFSATDAAGFESQATRHSRSTGSLDSRDNPKERPHSTA